MKRGEHDVRAVDHDVRVDVGIVHDETVVGEKRDELVGVQVRVVGVLDPAG